VSRRAPSAVEHLLNFFRWIDAVAVIGECSQVGRPNSQGGSYWSIAGTIHAVTLGAVAAEIKLACKRTRCG